MTGYKVLSKKNILFADRAQAGRLLALELLKLKGARPLVLGIPRGGIPVALELAHELQGEFDVIMTHKIGAPGYGELAIGSVTESGEVITEPDAVSMIDPDYFRAEEARQHQLLVDRLLVYRKVLPKLPLTGRQVIVTDDGIATGFTLEAALRAARRERPGKLIAAVPVAPEESLRRLAGAADEVVCLEAPPYFEAVGQFYAHFAPLADKEILDLLRQEASRRSRQ